jgi:hypothetical protein
MCRRIALAVLGLAYVKYWIVASGTIATFAPGPCVPSNIFKAAGHRFTLHRPTDRP